jgi:hypothetical protein
MEIIEVENVARVYRIGEVETRALDAAGKDRFYLSILRSDSRPHGL